MHNSRAGRPPTFNGSVPSKPNLEENVHCAGLETLSEAYDIHGPTPSDTPRRCLADILRSADTLMPTDTLALRPFDAERLKITQTTRSAVRWKAG